MRVCVCVCVCVCGGETLPGGPIPILSSAKQREVLFIKTKYRGRDYTSILVSPMLKKSNLDLY